MGRPKPKKPATKPYSGASFEAERKRFIEYLKTVLMLPPHEARREADAFFARHQQEMRHTRDRKRNASDSRVDEFKRSDIAVEKAFAELRNNMHRIGPHFGNLADKAAYATEDYERENALDYLAVLAEDLKKANSDQVGEVLSLKDDLYAFWFSGEQPSDADVLAAMKRYTDQTPPPGEARFNAGGVDVLCQCGWGRLGCPEDELPTQCPVCGYAFAQEPVELGSSMSPPLGADPRAVQCACGRLLYPGEVCSCSARRPRRNQSAACAYPGCPREPMSPERCEKFGYKPDLCFKHQVHGVNSCSVNCCGIKGHPGECDPVSNGLARCAGCGRETGSSSGLCSACSSPGFAPARRNGRALLPRSTRSWWRRNPDEMTVEEARQILSPWGGYSTLVHKAAVALPPHLRDPKIIKACEVLAALERRT